MTMARMTVEYLRNGRKAATYREEGELTREDCIQQARMALAEASMDPRGFDGITGGRQIHKLLPVTLSGMVVRRNGRIVHIERFPA
jgi:hypothetical protein